MLGVLITCLFVKLRGGIDQCFCSKSRSTIQYVKHVLCMLLKVLALYKQAHAAKQNNRLNSSITLSAIVYRPKKKSAWHSVEGIIIQEVA